MLAQQAYVFNIGGRNFHIKENPMQKKNFVFYVQEEQSWLS